MIDEDEPILEKAVGYKSFALSCFYCFCFLRHEVLLIVQLFIQDWDWVVSWKMFDSEDPKKEAKEGIQKHKADH